MECIGLGKSIQEHAKPTSSMRVQTGFVLKDDDDTTEHAEDDPNRRPGLAVLQELDLNKVTTVVHLLRSFLESKELVYLSHCCTLFRETLKGTTLRLDLLVKAPVTVEWVQREVIERGQWKLSGIHLVAFDQGQKCGLLDRLEGRVLEKNKLEHLSVRPYVDHGFRSVGKFTNLKSLKLLSCEWLNGSFETLATNCKFLEDIYINSLSLKTLNGLDKCPSLRKATFAQCDRLEDITAVGRPGCTLKNLALLGCNRVHDVSSISGNSSLQELNFTSLPELATGVEVIRGMNSVTKLRLSNCPNFGDYMTLSNNRKLTHLYMPMGFAESLTFCFGCENLLHLDIAHTLEVFGLFGIQFCINLETFVADYCSDLRDIADIGQCHNLLRVSFEGCHYIDSFSPLLYCPRLDPQVLCHYTNSNA